MRRFFAAAGVLGTMLAFAMPVWAEADPVGDTFNPNAIDITDLSACQSATSLVIDVTFAAAISPPAGDPPPSNALFGYIDLDLDANPETGNVSKLQYAPPGPGTELGIEGTLVIPDWDPVTQTIRFERDGAEDERVPITFATNAVRVTVPLGPGWAPSIHLGTIVGNFADATDVAPNTGYVSTTACCGNGRVDAGEDCDGGACCSSTCTFADGATCTDDDQCTVSDVCSATGTCAGTTRDCDDGDPCYDDGCEPTSGCAHVNRTGFPGVTCAFARTLPTLCNGQTIATTKLDKAGTVVGQAATATGARQRKLVKKAKTLLKAMGRLIARAQKKDKLTIECADGVKAQLADIDQRLAAAAGG
jgi:hypothetical protein